MFGKKIGSILFILFAVWSLLVFIFLVSHNSIQLWIGNLNYRICEVVSTSGCLTEHTYDYLDNQISKFGNFRITVKLEKEIKPDVYDTFFDKTEIIGKKMCTGDILTIVIEQLDADVFSKILNAPILPFTSNEHVIDVRYRSKKVAFISHEAKNIVKGYDVISDIQNNITDPSVKIFVATKLNSTGKSYNNEAYGDSQDETSQTGINHIFENGDFIREVEITPSNETNIKYFQN
ncbi:hypothetical protein [Vallitalea guaymasensis]|uniref:hypothetical protein n=1 Tax=Vallitalea guaymasensis TaxID=1185412 RepID=UPI000DE46023|nr:hypothetical protein [Vallitalea guaymasensis]